MLLHRAYRQHHTARDAHAWLTRHYGKLWWIYGCISYRRWRSVENGVKNWQHHGNAGVLIVKFLSQWHNAPVHKLVSRSASVCLCKNNDDRSKIESSVVTSLNNSLCVSLYTVPILKPQYYSAHTHLLKVRSVKTIKWKITELLVHSQVATTSTAYLIPSGWMQGWALWWSAWLNKTKVLQINSNSPWIYQDLMNIDGTILGPYIHVIWSGSEVVNMLTGLWSR